MSFNFRFICFVIILHGTCLFSQQTNYSGVVNPFIGTGGNGHTFPGAVLPFGMVQLSPDTRIDGSWEGCSGYHYSDSIIYGFSHTHLSGTGVSDYGDVMLMPTVGEAKLKNSEYASPFSHTTEKATAGFYEVQLENNRIKVELTTTHRVGIHRYTFPETNQANIILDLLHRDELLNSTLTIIDSVTVVGSRISTAWAKEQHVYFVIKFNKPIRKNGFTVFKETETTLPTQKNKEQIQNGFFQFNVLDGTPLLVKVAISQTSIDGAIKNLNAEAQHWDFDAYKNSAAKAWNNQLSKIEISSKNKSNDTTFYTALYHCMIHPSLAGDIDGQYRGRDNKIHTATGFTPYTVFSLWDTYRALHPLFTIIEPKRNTDFIHTFLQQYKESKRLPVWEFSANETDCMIGFHSAAIIADADKKNSSHFNIQEAYKAMLEASNADEFGKTLFNHKLYLEVNDESESVSKTLEYAYDNWCVAQVAKKLNKIGDYNLLMKRAQAYKNVFDEKTGFIRPRKNGNWLPNFNPTEVNSCYTEANGWQYNFYVPQDISGLMHLMGGDKKMVQKLNELFTAEAKTTGRTQVDITGLIGQYAHGNEPSHHVAYLYNYAGAPHKTQEIIHHITTTFYTNKPDGLIGNEDCGQMSAWYVLSTMGFYQVCPGNVEYAIGSPLFNEVTIHLENGKTTTLKTKADTTKNTALQYITAVSINKKRTLNSFLTHQQLVSGSAIEFKTRLKPDTLLGYGIKKINRPKSAIKDLGIVVSPIINGPTTAIKKPELITFSNYTRNTTVRYTTDNTEPTTHSPSYKKPFLIDSTCVIKAKSFVGKKSSSTSISEISKKPNTWDMHIISQYNPQYSAGGDEGIIDGTYGSINWRSGGWQGYQSQNFECIIDLKKVTPIHIICSNYLQDSRSWILFPKIVTYYTSEDGLNYTFFGTIENGVAPNDYSVQTRKFSSNNSFVTHAKYIKVIATNYGSLPSWHQGKGGDAFIFIDEIEIK